MKTSRPKREKSNWPATPLVEISGTADPMTSPLYFTHELRILKEIINIQGKTMMENPLPYTRQWIFPEDIEAVNEALASPFLTTGPMVNRAEEALKQITGAAHAVVCANGTAALHLACLAAGITRGDTGITSPISFLASANCIEYCNGRADFVDIDPKTLCLSSKALEAYCAKNPAPRVVIPVDFAGLAADLPAFHRLAQNHGFCLIEDAAHSLGSTYEVDGQTFNCGSCAHTEMAVMSFHPAKAATAAEGGVVLTNDPDLARRLKTFRNHGMEPGLDSLPELDGPWAYSMDRPGFNYRITDLQCALLLSQLEKLDRFARRRREVVRAYVDAFQGHDQLILPPTELGSLACPHLFPIQFKGGGATRKRIYEKMQGAGIHCQVHYIPIHLQPYYRKKYGYDLGKCPHGETYYSRALSLPLFPAMGDGDVSRVIQTLLSLV